MLKFRLMEFPSLLNGGSGSRQCSSAVVCARDPDDWVSGVWTAVMFVSIMVHEFGHALRASSARGPASSFMVSAV
jgi:hypothetical protein